MTRNSPASGTLSVISEEQACQILWQYFYKNKTTLVDDIRLSRDLIIMELIAGKPADDVFNRFIRPPEPSPSPQPRPIDAIRPARRLPTPAVFRLGKS